MPSSEQNPLRRFAARPPAPEFGNVTFSASLLDDGQEGTVRVTHADQTVALRAAGLTLPYPSGLDRARARFPDAELFVVDRAPRGLRRAASEQGVNYLDLRGHGRVVVPGFVYVAEPRPDVAGLVRNSASPFAPKASRVVRALLSDPSARWRLSDLAALSHSNPGNVHRTLSALVDSGVVERDEDSYVVADPGSLLEAWAEQKQVAREQVSVAVEGTLREDVERWLERLGGHAVVSGELAAEILAPYLPAESAIVHALSTDAFAAIEGNRARFPLLSGLAPGAGRLVLDLADEGVADFGTSAQGLPLASPQQVYVDLAGDVGRGREAAEHLRRHVLAY
jgi:hypothetical protein